MKSLAGRTVVITRPAEQAVETAALLASAGATALVIPLIEVVDEPDGMGELLDLDPSGTDWIVVTSPNGAKRASVLIGDNATSPKIAGVGSTTAAALPRCDLVATTQSASGLLKIFPSGPGKVVVVQASGAAPTLVDGLLEKGWTVTAIRPYRSAPITPSPEQRQAALSADAVLFASGSAAQAWAEAFGPVTPPVVVVIGEQTAAVAENLGLKVSVVSTDHSVYGMLDALSRYFSGGI